MIYTHIEADGRFTLIIPNNAAQQLQRALSRIVARDVIPDIERGLQRTLMIEPGAPKYPLRWKSEKQRRYVMAKLRRENNLPYKRTGQLAASWLVWTTSDRNSGVVGIENAASAARWVYTDDQQPFHQDTGWPRMEPVVDEYSGRAALLLLDGWERAIDEVING